MLTFHILDSQETIYHSYCHRADPSTLQGSHSKEYLFM